MSKETLTAYKQAGIDFLAAAKGRSDEELNSAPEGEWSIAYIVHHLFDAETYFATRYMNILIYENPGIVPFDEEKLPAALSYANRSVEASLQGLAGIHAVVEDLLADISDEQWGRTGNHPELGSVTLSQVLAKATSHLAEHVEQIKKTLA